MGFRDRLSHAWNAIVRDESSRTDNRVYDYGPTYSFNPTRARAMGGSDRSILTSIINRLSLDVASVPMVHVQQDDLGRFKNVIMSRLNECLNFDANLDQAGRHFRQSYINEMLTAGAVAIVPIETTGGDPYISDTYDVTQLRVGKIVSWHPDHVRVSVYDQRDGQRKEITVLKKVTVIVENPLYDVMNEPNGTLQRLSRKLTLLDTVDEQASTGKLDMIIQLPYTIRTDARRQQADVRRKDLEQQMKDSRLGIGYLDAAEKITQLNRPVENNMLKTIEYLTAQVYAQMGLTEAVFNGTASADEMLSYQNRTIEPILISFAEEFRRKFLGRNARTRGQTIDFFPDAFKLLPIKDLAEIADKFTRNEIMTANEFRQKLGMPPVDDPKADQLINSNMPVAATGVGVPGDPAAPATAPADASADMNATLDSLSQAVDDIFAQSDSSAS